MVQNPKQANPPSLPDVLAANKRETQLSINAVQIGIIQAFNPAKQTATIRLAIKQVIAVAPDGTRTLQEHPLILECPVMTNFGGSSHINLPIQAGDSCIVLFNDREIDNWLYNGGVQVPTTGRVHDISDAIAIVGIRSYKESIQNFLADGIRVWFAANSHMDFTDDAIDSVAALFTHVGNMRVEGSIYVTGDWYGENGGQMKVKTDLIQDPGFVLEAGNGADGTFSTVTVVKGIVVGGS